MPVADAHLGGAARPRSHPQTTKLYAGVLTGCRAAASARKLLCVATSMRRTVLRSGTPSNGTKCLRSETGASLLVCGFKIKTCAYERSTRVFWHESEAHVECHWQADAFWDIALGVHPAHCAVQDQAWFLPSACTTLSLPTALPLFQRRLACSMDISVRATHPLEISLSKKTDTVLRSASPAFQLPMHSVSS